MKAYYKNPADFKISACTITKNEEKAIAKSINSYKNYVDEIIIVDTGSTDDTVKIAQELGAKVYYFEWCNDFAAAKNTALEKVTGDWVIFLDADEYYADDTAQNLKAVMLEANLQGKNAIGCKMEQIDMDTGKWAGDNFSIRAYRSNMRYRYPVHEEIYNQGGGIDVLSVNKSYFYLRHTGYSNRLIAKKCERNIEILLDKLESEKDEKRKVYNYSYISDAYFGMGKHDKAIEYAKKFLESSDNLYLRLVGCETRPYLNIILGLEAQRAQPQEISQYVKMFHDKYPDCGDAAYAEARDCMRFYLFNTAIKKFGEAINLSESDDNTYMDIVGAQKAVVYVSCGVCEEGLLHTTQAMDWYFKAFKQEDNFQTALFNLVRIVHDMPQHEVDKFVESLYTGVSQARHISVLSALMCNYMVPQLIKCYAAYRSKNKEDTLNSNVTAFIMAGQGKYNLASKMFNFNYKSNVSTENSMRCLLCAALDGDKELLAQALEISTPAQGFALGLSEMQELTVNDLFDIAAVFIECSRLGRMDYGYEKMTAMANKLDDTQLLRLSSFLSDGFAFDAALRAAELVSISAESVFMQGYCLYRLRRPDEAVELLLLAKHAGCDRPAIDAILSSIDAANEKIGKKTDSVVKAQLKAQIEQKIEADDFDGAAGDLLTYMRIAEPDSDIFATLAAILYYRGEYKRAAVAAECGLLKDGSNFDLLYNAGCVYEKLHNYKKSKEMLLKAVENCDDPDTENEIMNILGAIKKSGI